MSRRDRMWFGSQFVLFVAMLAAPVLQRQRPPWIARLLGIVLLAIGGGVAGAGYRALGRSHSPWSTPVAGGRLITSGIYRWVRHPIYVGWYLGALGEALVSGSMLGLGIAAALAAFYDLRSREEERLLAERYGTYAAYLGSSSRFVPGIY
jgi:protein-S-isoprenylcysteine O-methyltransferase Ste14